MLPDVAVKTPLAFSIGWLILRAATERQSEDKPQTRATSNDLSSGFHVSLLPSAALVILASSSTLPSRIMALAIASSTLVAKAARFSTATLYSPINVDAS